MNEQVMANRFGDDLDAILQGNDPATQPAPEEYHDLLALSQSLFELDMSEDSRIRYTLKQQLLHASEQRPSQGEDSMNTRWKIGNRQYGMGLAAAAAALLLVMIAAALIPAVRVGASELFRFFVPGASDVNPAVQPTVTPPAQTSGEIPDHPEALSGLSLDEVIQAVEQDATFTYSVQVPGILPDNMTYADGIVNDFGRMVVLNYICGDRLADLSLIMRGLANPNPMVDSSIALEVGSSATVEAVTIQGISAEYVQGDFGIDGNWDSALPIQTLSWEHNAVLYRLRSYVQEGSSCIITKEDLIDTAASLLP